MKAAKMAGFTKNENIPKNEKFSNLGKSVVGAKRYSGQGYEAARAKPIPKF